ncbi:MAG: carboxymuconolactone decarboxylase family protein [Proteobacteria bacterium]|nr:carboxymuconolactone decarboxylase family protein [Pseudomonadota bacterium]
MARIPYPESNEVPENVKKYIDQTPRLNILRMMSRSGNLSDCFGTFAFHILADTKLDPIFREIAILRVGYVSKSAYEVFYHEEMIRKLGMSEEKIKAIQDDIKSPLFTDMERLVLEITDEIIHHVKMSDARFEKIHSLLSYQEVMELVMAISFYMLACRFLENYEIDLDEES